MKGIIGVLRLIWLQLKLRYLDLESWEILKGGICLTQEDLDRFRKMRERVNEIRLELKRSNHVGFC